ncbi:hypothetical protein V5N11_024120 [Cardamine amara subsp. amara]|uniref:Uncharacterized protein n=1 Tax=Cardamine amara subsp. amara TaxID=228776 RepID=A0ABD1B9F3_CARAN
MAGYAETSMAAQYSVSREALEMNSGQLRIDNLLAQLVDVKTYLEGSEEDDSRNELEVLLGRVKSAAASLCYLRSKARILAAPGLEDYNSSVSQVANPGEDTLTGTNKNQDSLVIEDGSYTLKVLQSIQMVNDAIDSLLRRLTEAEFEASFQKKNLSLRLEEMKRFVLRNQTVLDETAEIIKKLVEDCWRHREKAAENEEELRRVKTECESLRNQVIDSTNVIETLLVSEQELQILEARLVSSLLRLEGEKDAEVQKMMEENVKLSALLDKKEAQLQALNEQCKIMALNASNI